MARLLWLFSAVGTDGTPYRSSRATSSTTGATSRKTTRPITKTRKEPANGKKAFQPISISWS